MLPRVPGKERAGFVLKMFAGMMEHGTAGMSDEEFTEFKGRLQDILDHARPGGAVEVNGVELAPGGG